MFKKDYAQQNLVPNPGFENGNTEYATCNTDINPFNFRYGGDEIFIDDYINNWGTQGIIPPGFGTHTYSYPDWCTYSTAPYPGNNFYLHIIFGNIPENFGNRTRRDNVWVGLNGGNLQAYTTYILRLQIRTDNFVDVGSIAYPSGPTTNTLGFILSKYGPKWYVYTGNDKIEFDNAFSISTSLLPYTTLEYAFNTGSASDYKNLVLIMNSGGVDIDNVELFEFCPDNLAIQDKDYYYPEGDYQAGQTIAAGYNVGGPGPTGYVTVHNGGSTTYQAGQAIELKPGFSVQAGGLFLGKISPCVSPEVHRPENDTSIHLFTNTITLTCPIDTFHITGIDGDTNAYVSWFWNFGNGQTSVSSHPAVYYNTPGTDTITLYGKDSTGHIDTVIEYVVVPNCDMQHRAHKKSEDTNSSSSIMSSEIVISLQPNPFTDYTYLNFTLPQNENNTTLRITDMFGRVITAITGSYKQGANSVKINGVSLSPGCYFYELKTSQGRYCGKMVKVN